MVISYWFLLVRQAYATPYAARKHYNYVEYFFLVQDGEGDRVAVGKAFNNDCIVIVDSW